MNSRNFLPKTLFWRVFMILIMTVILSLFFVIWIFFDRHWDNITWRLSTLASQDLSYVVHRLEDSEASEHEAVLTEASHYLGISFNLSTEEKLSDVAIKKSHFYQDAPTGLLQESIAKRMENPFIINAFDKTIEVVIQTDEGVLYATFPKKRIFSSTIYVFLFVTFFSSLILVFVAMVMLRNQIQPILHLTKTVDAFGKGQNEQAEPLPPRGADEIRLATVAFNRMQERIRRQIRQRTDMLAGVSHDLRTPITRMKLELELMPESEELEKLKADLQNMEAMIESYLTFAQGEGAEISTKQNLGKLVSASVEQWRHQANIDLEITGDIELLVKPNAFRRCIDNLLNNAIRYGKNVAVTVFMQSDLAMILIDDDGPGIAEDKREAVFRPFYRLEKSRSSETGGYGLGLAIARDIARVHGGDVILESPPQGGTRAVISLPL